MTKEHENLRTRIVAGAVIQFCALVVLGVVVWIDSTYPDTDYAQIELLLAGIAAAPPARELVKQIRKDK